MDFIGREEELEILEEQYAMEHSFVIVKGRRRVGKSRLLEEFLRGKDHLYFEVDHETSVSILSSLSREVSGSSKVSMKFDSWTDALRHYISDSKKKKVIAIDEFPYAVSSDKELLKEFQALWDRYLSKANVMLILCGSSLTSMNGLTDNSRCPLYGRNTCDITLFPLSFRQCLLGKDYRFAVERYAVTGGVPHYMLLLGDRKPIEGLISMTMKPGAALMNEGEYLLGSEFSNLSSYNTYLRAIANGNRTMEKITGAVQATSGEILPYIKKLMDIGMVKKIIPVTEQHPEKSRKGQYIIGDNFIALWFRFVYPHMKAIARRENDVAIQDLKDHFVDAHVSFVFEDICRDELRRFLLSKNICAEYGKYWGKTEIDLIALDKKRNVAYVSECKYASKPIGLTVLNSLKNKASQIYELNGFSLVFCLFSVSGFNDDVAEKCGENVILFDKGEPIHSSVDWL